MKSIKQFIFCTALLGITGVAQAVPTLYVSTTGAAGSYVSLGSSASGTVSSASSLGVWSFWIITGNTYPAIGSAGSPAMTLSIQATSTGAGSLYIGFADNGYTGLGTINASLTGQVVSGASETYTFTTFADTSNVQPTTTLPTGASIITMSGSLPVNASPSAALPGTAPYVLGEVVGITATGASQNSINANLGFTPAGVPDGGMTVAMLGFGLAALGIARRKLAKA
jgi:hypothetical protein